MQGPAAVVQREGAVPREHERLLLVLTALGASLIFWLAPHPPMADLAQHGGQVMLMRDLLFGEARWGDVVRLNWLTPYLMGYLLALPLSLVLPVAAALKLLLSLGYLAFVGMCALLRRHFGADPRLDWLFLLPFFGLPYKWGFLTFLLAAPLALGVVLLASRYAQRPTPARGAAVFGAGLALLASHGLAFLFGWTVGAALLAAARVRRRVPLAAFVPHALLALACAAYFVASRRMEADFSVPYDYFQKLDWGWKRLIKAPLYTVGAREDLALLPAVALLLAVPWLLGLRPARTRSRACIPFAIVAAMMLAIPSFALNTAFLYERFALFLLPSYAWMFATVPGTLRAPAWRHGARWVVPLAMATCWAVLSVHALRAWRFGEETRGIDAAIARMAPGERALLLVFDGASAASNNPFVYIQYPAWYQAERGGMVDFNFAWFPPQIVRFRRDRLPAWQPGSEWRPDRFEWARHRGDDYRYFVVRGVPPASASAFRGAPCPPVRLWSDEAWTVYERGTCR